MADKVLIMEEGEFEEGHKHMTVLVGNTKDETIYAEFIDTINGEPNFETVELAVHVDDIIKMRDFLNTIISKIGPAGEYTEDNIFIKARVEAN